MNSPCTMFQVAVISSFVVFLILGTLAPRLVAQVSYKELNCRKHISKLSDFGGVGDGKTLNTDAFNKAISNLSGYSDYGGSLLQVSPGVYLTGSFNLTSNFTLYLDKGALILASTDESLFPTVAPLPSYGRGREAYGPRKAAFIGGNNLRDVVITGDNGTIDGQGAIWWDKFKKKQLPNITRPYLIEFMFSHEIQVSKVFLKNSPSWTFHAYASSFIIIENLTIYAPVNSPNTDAMDIDSSQDVSIKNCFVTSGDDIVALKSGWDEYGIDFNKATERVVIRNLSGISPTSAFIAIGSELSGGVRDVRASDLYALNTESLFRFKTAPGRGGSVKDIFLENAVASNMKYGMWTTNDYGDHSDGGYNVSAQTEVNNINLKNVRAVNVSMAGQLHGSKENIFKGICLSNMMISPNLTFQKASTVFWNCSDVQGKSYKVNPTPCKEFSVESSDCSRFPKDDLVIDNVKLQSCSF